METAKRTQERYSKAKKRVQTIRGFYIQLIAFAVVTLAILLFGYNYSEYISFGDGSTSAWVTWNITAIPIIWGAWLIIHGLFVFRFKFRFFNRWEERTIRKIMEKTEE